MLAHKRPAEKTELQCALLLFGIELHWLRRLKFNYSDFKNYYFVNWRKCEDAFYNNIDNNYGPFRKSVFNGLQTNYMTAVQIDVDQCKGVRQFAEALRKIVVDIKDRRARESADAFSGFNRIESADLLADLYLILESGFAEHFLQRLYALIISKSASICQIGEELDFVQTVQNVASTEQLEFVQTNDNHSCFFKFKINISKEIVAINLPNWKLPNYMREENINELRQQKVKKNFDFLLSLSNCTPTFYEILKVAKKLGDIELPKDDAKKYEIWLNCPHNELQQIVTEISRKLNKLSKMAIGIIPI
uniref:Uncharacterized protein n=1 Tax=Globodera rostochiensis TaxID=31243 RepID=A0A914I1D8_GLORO